MDDNSLDETASADLAIDAVGVEVDPVTASIAKALHPDATIRSESFAGTRFPDGWFDLTIGKVPFGDYNLFDPIYNRAGRSIHNHFIAKSLRADRRVCDGDSRWEACAIERQSCNFLASRERRRVGARRQDGTGHGEDVA